MKAQLRILILFMMAIFTLGTFPAAASANVIYTYTGNNFTQVSDDPNAPGTFTTSQHISITFELTQALGPNSGVNPLGQPTGTPHNFVHFSVDDGRSVLRDGLNPSFFFDGFRHLSLGTNANGIPSQWYIETEFASLFGTSVIINGILSINSAAAPAVVLDSAYFEDSSKPLLRPSDNASVSNSPGVWTVQTPETSSLSLLFVGLFALAWKFRKSERDGGVD